MTNSIRYTIHRFIDRLSHWRRWDICKKIRGWHYTVLLNQAGTNLRLGENVKLANPRNISVGNNCYLGDEVQLYAWKSPITIGDQVLVAAGVRMITRKHGFADIELPMAEQGYTHAPIVIADNVWIGFGAIILPGVTIGQGSIVGAGAVVTKSVEPFSVVGGVPARLIRYRQNLIHESRNE